MANTPSDLLIACWAQYTLEMVTGMDASTDLGVPAKLTAGVFQAMVDVKKSIDALMVATNAIEELLVEWRKAGLLDDKMAASRARKILDIRVERKDDN